MIRLVARTDVHLSDQIPESRTDDWATTLLGKLRQVGRIAREVGAVGVLDNGDFFHIKSPSQTSHDLNRKVAEVHADYPCPVYGNIGNHDVIYGDYKYISQQPLGVLFAAGVFRRCYDEHEHLFMDDDGQAVRLVGIPFHGAKYDLDRFKITKGQEDWLVVMAHVLASERGGSMFDNEDIVKHADLLSLAPDVDVWMFGHWHKDQGIKEIAPGKWVFNVGALSRGALSQDDVERRPGVAIIEFSPLGIEITKRELDVEDAKDVFNIEGRIRKETRAATMVAFVESIHETLQNRQAGLSLEEKIEAMKIPQEVRERALLYLESAEVGMEDAD